MDGTLRIDIGQRDGATVLSVEGEIDLATASMLDEQITAAIAAGTNETVIVDLDQVSFMDSTGLQVLLSHVFSEQNGSRIRVTKGSHQVHRLFEVSGMIDQLPFTSGESPRQPRSSG
jgi:anti-anti-sigma factor